MLKVDRGLATNRRVLVLCQRFDFGFMPISEHSVFVYRRTTCVFGGRASPTLIPRIDDALARC
jgi:hypothetical protein